MPRTARASVGGVCYHVFNRGNGRAEVYYKDEHYAAFLKLLAEASRRVPMRLLAYCFLPNHFHMVLWRREDGDLGRSMQWLLTSHVGRYHQHVGWGDVNLGSGGARPLDLRCSRRQGANRRPTVCIAPPRISATSTHPTT